MGANWKANLWVAIVAAASILFSLALACATPFAAIATVAGVNLRLRQALVLTGFAWLANQAVGYLVLGYPTTWDSFAWGAAIALAALAATAVVFAVRPRLGSELTAILVGFAAAFCIYETALFAATALLPSGDGAFSAQVVLDIFWTNALALIGLVILHRAALAIGMISHEGPRAGSYA